MLEKDLRLFIRDQRTLALIILTPIIIMLILGMIFSAQTTEESITGITLGVCNLDDNKLDIDVPIFNMIDLVDYKDKKNTVYVGSKDEVCEARAKDMVKKGELRGAVIIPANFSRNINQGMGSNLILYVDNAKSQTAIVTVDSMKAIVQDMNEKIGTAFIEEAWVQLNELNDKLKFTVEKLAIAKATSIQIQEKMVQYEDTLDRINMSKAYYYAALLEDNIDDAKAIVDSTMLLIETPISNVTTINESMLPAISVGVDIGPLIQALKDEYDANCTGNLTTTPPCVALNNTIHEMENVSILLNNELDKIEDYQNLTSGHIQQFKDKIAEFETKQNITLDKIRDLKIILDNTTEASALMYAQITVVEELKNNLSIEIKLMSETSRNFTNQIVVLTDELNQTTKVLDEYTSKDPINIIRPVTLKQMTIHGKKSYFEFLAPGLIALILMFIMLFISSGNIVSERQNGTMARNFLSPTSIALFLFEKTIYLLILAFIQTALMIVLCMILGVSITITPSLLLAVLVMSLSFITLGLLIGGLSKTENTALLTSLVIGLPMLFLSGLFFPFEMMPDFIKVIGTNLPLTLSIVNLERMITYNTMLDYTLLLKLLIISAVMFAFAYLLVKLKPTAE